jgi:hypothetical protein
MTSFLESGLFCPARPIFRLVSSDVGNLYLWRRQDRLIRKMSLSRRCLRSAKTRHNDHE